MSDVDVGWCVGVGGGGVGVDGGVRIGDCDGVARDRIGGAVVLVLVVLMLVVLMLVYRCWCWCGC